MYSGLKYLFQLTINRPKAIIMSCQVGCPIRKSMDQRVLSPPHGLSQSATSFIASYRLGIHQTPLSRLIRDSESRRKLVPDEVRDPAVQWTDGKRSAEGRKVRGCGRRPQPSQPAHTFTCPSIPWAPRQRSPLVSALDLERLCSCCRTLGSHGVRKSPSRLKRFLPPTPHSGQT